MVSPASDGHDKLIKRIYITLVIVFLCMVGINIYAYLTITHMGRIYSSLDKAAVSFKLNVTNANLLFRDIISGDSAENMNEVWKLIEDAKTKTEIIGEIDKNRTLETSLEKFRISLVELCKSRNSPENTALLKAEYTQAVTELNQKADAIESQLRGLITQKMKTFNVLYIILIINIIVLFAFIVYTFKHYSSGRELAEIKLSNAQRNLSVIIDSLDSMVLSVDSFGRIIWLNSVALKYLKTAPENILGREAGTVVPFLRDYQPAIKKVFYSKEPLKLYREKIITDNEKFFNMTMTYVYSIDSVLICAEDATEREMKDEQLLRFQKLEVVENLIEGLANNFNNVLGAITGTVTTLKYSLKNEKISADEMKENMDTIESSAERATTMVRQLLSLCSKEEIKLATVNLNNSIENVLKICENTFDKRIELEAELYDAPAMIKADPARMEQVLLNLCDNAAHAMTIMKKEGEHKGGILKITMEKIFPNKKFRENQPLAVEDSYWMISISDTGVGMDTKVISKIFDPFFTTKADSHATGLGLSIADNIVRRLNGFMEVKSEVGAGSTFVVFLPELAQEPEFAKPSKEIITPEEEIPLGSGLILVVDDELVMRKTAKGILEKLGYTVMLAENGEEAVKIFKDNYKKIKAVILDMSMPGISGEETYVEMEKIYPELKVLLASGFKKDQHIQKALDIGFDGFIKKPYTLAELAQEIKEVIG